MNFLEAVKLADSKKALIGKKVKGATLDEIITVPTSKDDFGAFEQLYVQTLNAQQSIAPFINSDVEVIGVYDKFRIRQMNAVIFSNLPE